MLPEQGDRVQLLPLNADTHAEQQMRARTHIRTPAQSQPRLGQPGSKHLYSWKVLHWLHHLQCFI